MTLLGEKFGRGAITTLASGITNSSSTLSVDSASGFPTSGNFRIRIDSELIMVTAVSGTTFTITRGIEGTTAASHSGGAEVAQILTAGGIDRFMWDRGLRLRPPFGITKFGAPMTVSDFTWFNQGSATAIDSNKVIYMTCPNDTGQQVRGLVTSMPTPPYTVVVGVRPQLYNRLITNVHDGDVQVLPILARDSGSSKIEAIRTKAVGNDTTSIDTGGFRTNIDKYTDSTTFSASYLTNGIEPFFNGNVWWYKLEDDGTDFTWFFSTNGYHWFELESHSRTTFLASPDQIGFALNPAGTDSDPSRTIIAHFSVY